MFEFLRKQKRYKTIKLYKIVDVSMSKAFPFKTCANLCLDYIKNCNGNYPTSFNINYSNKVWNSKSAFDKAVEKKKDTDLVLLYASSGDYYMPLTISNDMMNSTEPSLYNSISIEISIEDSSFNYETTASFLHNLYEKFAFDYGYIFVISDNFDSSSERKFKKGLFSFSIAGKDIDIRWYQYITAIRHGYIRKIYPFNFLNKSHLEQPVISDLLSKKIGILTKFNSDLWTWELNENDFLIAEKTLNKSKFVIINDNNPKLFIENAEVQKFYEERKEDTLQFGSKI